MSALRSSKRGPVSAVSFSAFFPSAAGTTSVEFESLHFTADVPANTASEAGRENMRREKGEHSREDMVARQRRVSPVCGHVVVNI
jgi:hypothetical protein